ncbi:hypothetical protein WEI85_00580 [Actinomycetes bacterium KLBMP 9797]
MGEHVTVENNHHIRIDVAGWVAQRVGDEHAELTASLRDWGRLEHLNHSGWDWMSLAELWCLAREYQIAEGGPTLHEHYWLSSEVSFLLAVAGDLGPVAIVCIDGNAPTVYADITTDDGYWHQVDIVDIVCPCGRRWSWSDTELIDSDGEATTVKAVFGDRPHSPFTPCPHCVAYDNDETDTPCPTPGTDPIICPHCGQRCDLELAAVATYPQRRPYAVSVSEQIEYAGWVLATDPDDADDEARRLLAQGLRDSVSGHLDVVRVDREVAANDASEVCWRCRTDPRQPHPDCTHPSPRGDSIRTARSTGAAVTFDPVTATRWLRSPNAEHPAGSNADALGVDEEVFGRGRDGFLSTVDDVLAAHPAGLIYRADVRDVLLWLIPDGEVPDQGAVITVDLANGIRLATHYQGVKEFADRDANGVEAAVSALAHIAAQASALVAHFQRGNPAYQPA